MLRVDVWDSNYNERWTAGCAADVNALGFAKTFPDLATEALSPSNAAAEMLRKLEIYLKSGVSGVWIVDPVGEAAEMHRPGQAAARIGLDGFLEDASLLPGFGLLLRDLLRRR